MRRTVALAFCLIVSACGRGGDDGAITVFAAASLTEVMTELGRAFEETHDVSVRFNFAGSSQLIGQIADGAPADVFAPADEFSMGRLVALDRATGTPSVFATNSVVLAVAPGNPEGLRGIGDLTEDLVVVQCAVEVPCGIYAADVLAAAGITGVVDSFERNVKAVVAKIALGEADAGIVYVTDVLAARGDVDGVEIPPTDNVTAAYPIALTAQGRSSGSARRFVDFVLGPTGQEILERFGFASP